MDGLMTIGEFSAVSGLSPKRLRSYARRGLLSPAAVDPESAYRYYSPDQLPDAELVDVLRQAGMPLDEIKFIVLDRTSHRLDEWARRLRADADVRQQAVARARSLLSSQRTGATGRDEHRGDKMTMQLQVAGRTEAGPVRENNEDAIVVDERLLAVADGMGGHQGGETASALATATLAAVFTGKSSDELEAAVRAANWAVWERARNAAGLQGMGTTMCAVGVLDEVTAAVAHVGDSRAYLFRAGTLQLLTNDHTVAAELMRKGQLDEEEAAKHPHRRLLTRALGVAAEVSIDVTGLQLHDGDRILICSDGVFTVIPDDQIATLLQSAETPQDGADAVVDLALANGSDDNASAVVAFAQAGLAG